MPGADPYAGLPDDARTLLANPPVTDKKLLELSATWADDLGAAQARVSNALRIFVITWDPLELVGMDVHKWIPPRPPGLATVNGDPLGLDELVLYAPHWAVVELARNRSTTVAAVLGEMAGQAVLTAAMRELTAWAEAGDPDASYPERAVQSALADLDLGEPDDESPRPTGLQLVSDDWQDMGLGAITDIVQHAYGHVDFDRSLVELSVADRPDPQCPACSGRRFAFPGDLMEHIERMCSAHHDAGHKVVNQRFARASASNADGWAAIGHASTRLSQPHVPNGLSIKFTTGARAVAYDDHPVEMLLEIAEDVIKAAGWFENRPDDFLAALGEKQTAGHPEWLTTLGTMISHDGLGEEAARIYVALARVDPSLTSFYAAQAFLSLAIAGDQDGFRDRLKAALAEHADDFHVRFNAGVAFVRLDHPHEAEPHLRAADTIAENSRDRHAKRSVDGMLREIGLTSAYGTPAARKAMRRQPRRKPSRSQRRPHH